MDDGDGGPQQQQQQPQQNAQQNAQQAQQNAQRQRRRQARQVELRQGAVRLGIIVRQVSVAIMAISLLLLLVFEVYSPFEN